MGTFVQKTKSRNPRTLSVPEEEEITICTHKDFYVFMAK